MVKAIISALLLSVSISLMGQQSHDPDSVMQVVLGALTLEEHEVSGNIDSLLHEGSWEALAYWDMTTPKDAESLQEAVGDRYTFEGTTFMIQFVDPNNPRQFGTTVEGYFVRKGYVIEMYKTESGPRSSFEIWYLDNRYMVIEVDGLRIFLTREKSYYLTD